jgi:hypothetical protein
LPARTVLEHGAELLEQQTDLIVARIAFGLRLDIIAFRVNPAGSAGELIILDAIGVDDQAIQRVEHCGEPSTRAEGC